MANNRPQQAWRPPGPTQITMEPVTTETSRGLASNLSSAGRFPELRSKLISRLQGLYEREDVAIEQLLQAKEAEVSLVEEMAAETAATYEASVKFFKKNGS